MPAGRPRRASRGRVRTRSQPGESGKLGSPVPSRLHRRSRAHDGSGGRRRSPGVHAARYDGIPPRRRRVESGTSARRSASRQRVDARAAGPPERGTTRSIGVGGLLRGFGDSHFRYEAWLSEKPPTSSLDPFYGWAPNGHHLPVPRWRTAAFSSRSTSLAPTFASVQRIFRDGFMQQPPRHAEARSGPIRPCSVIRPGSFGTKGATLASGALQEFAALRPASRAHGNRFEALRSRERRSGRRGAGSLGVVAPRSPGGDEQCAEADHRGGEPHDSADDGDDRQHTEDG